MVLIAESTAKVVSDRLKRYQNIKSINQSHYLHTLDREREGLGGFSLTESLAFKKKRLYLISGTIYTSAFTPPPPSSPTTSAVQSRDDISQEELLPQGTREMKPTESSPSTSYGDTSCSATSSTLPLVGKGRPRLS